MQGDDREILVSTKYPIPPYVEGINYYVENEPLEEESLENVTDPYEFVDDSEVDESYLQPPTPLAVVDQVVSYGAGGAVQVDGVLIIEETPYISEYEIRVIPR